jgi:ubiquinone/menaquinone biosynthesis C-methylase UbiE
MTAIGSHDHDHHHNTACSHEQAHKETGDTTMNSMPGWLYDGMLFVWTLGRESRQRREFLTLAQIRTGERVLDVGCGTGHLARLVADETLAGSVRGIDPNRSMIARAQKQAASEHLHFDVGTAQLLPVADACVDVVFCTFAYHHFPSAAIQRQALAEMLRVLVPGGGRLLLVDFPGGLHPHGGGHHDHSHGHEHTSDQAQHFHNPFSHCQTACCESKRNKQRKDEDVANDPLLDRIREAGFDRVTGHPVTMLGGVAVLAFKP